jgi:hypothetical protein
MKAVFERFWHHIIIKLNNYATKEALDSHNEAEDAHNDIREIIETK